MTIIDTLIRLTLLTVLAGTAVVFIAWARDFHRAGMRRLAAYQQQNQQPRTRTEQHPRHAPATPATPHRRPTRGHHAA